MSREAHVHGRYDGDAVLVMEIDDALVKKLGFGVLLGWGCFLVTLWLLSVIGEPALAMVAVGFAVAVMIGLQPGRQATGWAFVTTLTVLVVGLVSLLTYLGHQEWLD